MARPDTMPPSTSLEPRIGVVRLPHGADLPLPAYETEGAAGLDLRAAVPADRPILILPGRRALVPTGLVFELPEGFEGQVRPRSGLAYRHGITCLNSPGTLDWDYRGELKVILANFGDEEFSVSRGMRIAQLVIAPVSRARLEERVHASETLRSSGGFGSTGIGREENGNGQ
ncbi:dUTP diphosphatase [Mesorhizobium sp. RP14(2022)]|uniref:Deoxyuridine 5'-triphosphate nucleotidohydrolase n=1 Tax=Mesorhizobium liriopis TaxID=2953882 RepID=A0ABT1C415_9HYPH|nr:dUTP diphosphatase [Mesorhizobium liriopis]MCO6049564.1 dUTP diphosphatase [Mesorhizobium liriopis]